MSRGEPDTARSRLRKSIKDHREMGRPDGYEALFAIGDVCGLIDAFRAGYLAAIQDVLKDVGHD